MQSIIIYGSCYGTTKKYAEGMAEKTGIDAISFEKAADLHQYVRIIYFGGLYAGGVLGLSKTLKNLQDISNKRIDIVTVGLADTTDTDNIQSIRKSIQKQLSKELYDHAQIFHLRGGIDYQKLSFKHKTMMALLYNKVKKIPPEKRNAETKALIETYGQKVDFVNLDMLNSIK